LMWLNQEVLTFADWLRAYNAAMPVRQFGRIIRMSAMPRLRRWA
jgi:erythromycin esterase-like protein